MKVIKRNSLRLTSWTNIGLIIALIAMIIPTGVLASVIPPAPVYEVYSEQTTEVSEENRTVDDVVSAFDALTHHGEWLGFHMGPAPDTYPPPSDEHIQGIARSPQTGSPIFYVTRSGNLYDSDYSGSLMVVEMGTRDTDGERLRSNRLLKGEETRNTPPHTMDRVIKNIPFYNWEHPGGIQMVGDILAVPLEKLRPAIVITATANNTIGTFTRSGINTAAIITQDVGQIGTATILPTPVGDPSPFILPDIGDQFMIISNEMPSDSGLITASSGTIEVTAIGNSAYNLPTGEWVLLFDTGDFGKVIFYDCSNPRDPQKLDYEMNFDDITTFPLHHVGVLGFTKLPGEAPGVDGSFFIAVSWGDGETVEFYRSNKNSFFDTNGDEDPEFDFQYHSRLERSDLELLENAGFWRFGKTTFQTLNFVAQQDGALFLIASSNTSPTTPMLNGADFMYLIEVTGFGANEEVEFTGISIAQKWLGSEGCADTWTSGGITVSQNQQSNFNASGGAYVSPTGELLYYSTSYYNKGPYGTVKMAELRHNWVSSSGTCGPQFQDNQLGGPYNIDEGFSIALNGEEYLDGHCMMPWAQMFADSDFQGPMVMMDFSDQFSDDYNDFKKLDGCATPLPDGFNDQLSSFRFCGPPGSILWLFDDDNYRIGNTSFPPVPGTGKVIEVPFVGSYFNDEATSALLLWNSYSSQPYSWDLDNDGEFDDAFGPTATFQAGSESSTNIVRMKYVYSDDWTFDYYGVQIPFPETYAIFETTINVGSVALTVNAGPDATISEGGIFNSSGNFIDSGSGPWEATVDYGDASGAQPLTLDLDNKTFNLNHVYADNGTYTAMVTISAGEGDDKYEGSDAAIVTVENVSPVVNAGPDISVSSGLTFSISAGFSDVGVNDNPWTFIIDWGNSSPLTAGSSDIQGVNTVIGDHQYSSPDIYTVVVTVTDKDGGIGTDTLQVEVISTLLPSFTVTDLVINPEIVEVGENIDVTVIVTNIGNITGNRDVSLIVDDVLEQVQAVTLDGGESELVTFNISKDAIGLYVIDIDRLSGSFVVREIAPTPTEEEITPQEPDDGPTPDPGTMPEQVPKPVANWLIIGGIAIGVIFMGLALYYFITKKKQTA